MKYDEVTLQLQLNIIPLMNYHSTASSLVFSKTKPFDIMFVWKILHADLLVWQDNGQMQTSWLVHITIINFNILACETV